MLRASLNMFISRMNESEDVEKVFLPASTLKNPLSPYILDTDPVGFFCFLVIDTF